MRFVISSFESLYSRLCSSIVATSRKQVTHRLCIVVFGLIRIQQLSRDLKESWYTWYLWRVIVTHYDIVLPIENGWNTCDVTGTWPGHGQVPIPHLSNVLPSPNCPWSDFTFDEESVNYDWYTCSRHFFGKQKSLQDSRNARMWYKRTDTLCTKFKMIWTYDLTSIFKVEWRSLYTTFIIKQLT